MKGSFKVSYALLDDQWYHLEVAEGLSEQRRFVGNDVGIKESNIGWPLQLHA